MTIELVGGIGNQLFGYFAGLYVSEKLGLGLRAYIRKPARGESSHSSSLISLAPLPGFMGRETAPVILEKYLRFTLHKFLTIKPMSMLGIRDFSGFHSSSSIGYDHSLDGALPVSFLRGYFQTYKYFEYLDSVGALPNLALPNPSNSFKALSQEMRDSKPLTMHIRRGDYLNKVNSSIGTLSPKYFEGALDLLREKSEFTNREVWIFSDDIPLVQQEFMGLRLGPHRWISDTDLADAQESLLLMSLGAGTVISNSTFSWWSAMLGRISAVVAPDPWFRIHPEPDALLNPKWMRYKSDWLDSQRATD